MSPTVSPTVSTIAPLTVIVTDTAVAKVSHSDEDTYEMLAILFSVLAGVLLVALAIVIYQRREVYEIKY